MTSSYNPAEKEAVRRSITDLPDEVMLIIFKHLEFYYVEICADVCSRWKTIIHVPTLYTHLEYNKKINVHCSISRFSNIVGRSKCLVSLILDYHGDCKEVLQTALENCNKLEKLVVKNLFQCKNEFLQFYKSFPNLTYLDLECGDLPQSSTNPGVWGFKNLETLIVCSCFPFNDATMMEVSNASAKLKVLDLHNVSKLTNRSVIFLMFKLGEQLTHLYLDGRKLTDDAMQSFRNCKNLVHLSISMCDTFTDFTLNGFYYLYKLRYLRLCGGKNFTSKGLQNMFLHGQFKKLIKLDLSDCFKVDNALLDVFSEACPNITHYVLNSCYDLNNAGVIAFVNGNPQIRKLELVGMKNVNHATFEYIIRKIPSLELLDIKECLSLNLKEITRLTVDKPSLKIFGTGLRWFICIQNGQMNVLDIEPEESRYSYREI